MNKINDSHAIFLRLVGRALGALDLAHVDDTLKRTIKAYIWQAEKDINDLPKNCQFSGVDNGTKKE